jgi:glycosyltransferase involved in cell wall biosynthesis|tara:strand:+ start:2228 stop:3403 length:1176 start_codon:yes stop_codon:yes gene_type:complete
MRKLFYMGLEPYEGRYTLQLQDWSEAAFKKRGIEYVVVPGETIDDTKAISVGQVLDAHGRSYFGMSQLMNLVQLMRNGECSGEDVVFFEDMFQPGMESLPYIMCQIPEEQRPTIYLRCLAQAVDPDDFVHVWGMSKWMSLYEQMCNEIPNVHILATNEEMVAHMRIANWTAPIYNISGLSFGKDEVLSRVNTQVKPWEERSDRVVFAARFDQEKQPDFFMDVIEMVKAINPNIEFAVLSGGPLRSNNQKYLDRALQMEADGQLTILKDLQKNDYYNVVNDSKVMFNCALQDWVSNTVSEADALGCNVVYPAYRSFPETFANDHTRLYMPWSKEDAVSKILAGVEAPSDKMGKISNWTNGTIDRMVDIMQGTGQQWLRSGNRYRDHVAEEKY